MEKLKRVYQKIFASKSGNDETVAFGSTAQGSTVYTKELADIQTEAFEEGIKSSLVAGEAPIWEDNNSVFYEITSQLAYLFQQGISEWDSETTYFIGSFCTVIEGESVKLYYSLADNNKENDPSNDDINWKAIDINIDLSKYVNTDLSNVDSNIDYIIERGSNESGWYVKYKSGWIEQGGTFTAAGNSLRTVIFPTPFLVEVKNIQITGGSLTNADNGYETNISSNTLTGFNQVYVTWSAPNPSDVRRFWFAQGF